MPAAAIPPARGSVFQPWRLGTFYAAYYATAGVLAPYFPLYLEQRGLTAAEIGVVMALAQGLRVVGPTVWGWLADHTSHRVAVLRFTALVACLSFVPMLHPGGFGFVFIVMLVFNLFLAGQVPVAEAIATLHLREDPDAAARYGRLRACGSIGFIGLVLLTGAWLDRAGVALTPYLLVGLLALIFASTCVVRDVHAPAEPGPARNSVLERLRERRVRWFFASAFLMIFAHSALYTYLSIYLAQLGYTKFQIGVFWVLGVVIEIVLFYSQGRLFKRFDLLRLIELSLLVAGVRFFLIAELAQIAVVLVVAQLLHAVTFAMHHSASVLTIQRWFGGRTAARGQALYTSIGYGAGGTLGSLVAALLWTQVSPSAAFLSSSVAAWLGWIAVRRARKWDRSVSAVGLAGQ
jgi:MFS transporter, PPP family, 3-phenylpropionic acid transporter